ncbi:MAG: radical SAM protein [Bdellovibrionales bacterium]|nr:radical SAM protein [Bdellovibrionales bacterium]
MSLNTKPAKYGFYGRLNEAFPSQIVVDATEVCNLACIHCPHPEYKQGPHYAARALDPELNKKMVDEVREFGGNRTQYIRYTSNGEPLAHRNIFEMLAYAAAHSGVQVTLTTNGKVLNAKRVEALLQTKISMVDISLDAFHADTYSKIRVGGDLNEVRANVLRLLERRDQTGSSLRVVLSFVEQPQNLGESAPFEEFWKSKGANFVVIRRLHSAAGANMSIASNIWQHADSGDRKPCVYPWERIVLKASGHIGFCPQDWEEGSAIADYRTSTIRQVWQGETYRRLREAHLKNEYGCHNFCGKCPDWSLTRWPGEGRSYADMMEDFRREGAEVHVAEV